MRILFLNHNVAFKGGTFFRAYHFARHLVQLGHEVTLYTISPKSHLKFTYRELDGIQLVETPDLLWGIGRTGWDMWDTMARIFSVAGGTWDVVHAFDSRPAVIIPALFVQRRCGAKLILDWADWWGRGGTSSERKSKLLRYGIGPIETFFEEHFRNRADATTVISRALAQRVQSLGVSPESTLLLSNGSDTEGIKVLDRETSREELGLSCDGPLLGYLGTAMPADADLLLDSYSEIWRKDNRARLILIGNHVIRSNRNRCGGQVIETGFIDRVKMNKYLAACDLMLLPLRDTIANRGRWPSKINDYLAAGRAVVTMPVGELAGLFSRVELGQLAGESPAEFAEATLTLLDDEPRRSRCERNARRVAEEQFAWPKLTRQLENLYEHSLQRDQAAIAGLVSS